MQQIDIPAFINHLNTDSSITAITSNRIYFWLPTSNQTWIYITVSVRREYQDIVNKAADLRIRFIAHNETVKLSQLYNLRKLFVNHFVKDNWALSFSNFYWFAETSTCFDDYLDWNRPYVEIWLRAYLLN
jgi:hypothetical protein